VIRAAAGASIGDRDRPIIVDFGPAGSAPQTGPFVDADANDRKRVQTSRKRGTEGRVATVVWPQRKLLGTARRHALGVASITQFVYCTFADKPKAIAETGERGEWREVVA
jgi:hypothetical protein